MKGYPYFKETVGSTVVQVWSGITTEVQSLTFGVSMCAAVASRNIKQIL